MFDHNTDAIIVSANGTLIGIFRSMDAGRVLYDRLLVFKTSAQKKTALVLGDRFDFFAATIDRTHRSHADRLLYSVGGIRR